MTLKRRQPPDTRSTSRGIAHVIAKTIKLLFICAFLASCDGANNVTTAESPFDAVDRMFRELNGTCDYPVLEKYRRDKQFICQLGELKSRCNKIDDCYVYCLGNDIGNDVGGGCTHLCNYALRKEWNAPESIKKCTANPGQIEVAPSPQTRG